MELNGVLYVYVQDETKIRKIDLNSDFIAAGQTSGSLIFLELTILYEQQRRLV